MFRHTLVSTIFMSVSAAITMNAADTGSDNPAMMYYSPGGTRSTLVAGYGHTVSDEPVVVQEGDGLSAGRIDARSFVRIDSCSAAYGTAGFLAGRRRDVVWNNSADYRRVAPYVLGDSVGGDITVRQYSFSGGYTRRHSRWTWGAYGAYRAAMNHRSRDPRLKIVVSELNISAGATMRVSDSYAIGISGAFGTYSQESDVEFYNPINDIKVYALTGLGTVYSRFSGNSNESAAHSGASFAVSAQLQRLKDSGITATAMYGSHGMTLRLRDFNNLGLASTHTTVARADVSYIRTAGNIVLSAEMSAEWNRVDGTENLFGSSAGNQYEKISSRRYYRHDTGKAIIDIPVSISAGGRRHSFTLCPGAELFYDSESYVSPCRKLAMHAVAPHASVGYALNGSAKWTLRLRAEGGLTVARATDAELTGLATESSIGRMTVHNFEMLIADRHMAAVDALWIHTVTGDMSLSLSMRAVYLDYPGHGDSFALHAGVGLIF